MVGLRFAESDIGEEFAELVGEGSDSSVLRVDGFGGFWVDWRAGVIGSRKGEDVLVQGGGDRDEEWLARLAGDDSDLLALEVDLRPSEDGQVPEALAGIEAELYEALPFGACDIEDGAEFIDCERSTLRGFAVLDGFDAFGRVLEQKAVHSSAAEDAADDLQVCVGGGRGGAV